MKVAIDARKLHDFGIGTYIRNILRQLARIDRQTEYILICQPRDRELSLSLGDNFRVEVDSSPPYSLREQISIPWTLVRTRANMLHEPHYVLPPLAVCRSVVTIHDCIHLRFPQDLPNRAALTYARAQMGSAARRSDRILTVSEASKRDILEFFDVPPEKITVIYNAIDEHFAAAPDDEAIQRVAERYQLQDKFVLYVGNVKPHKNLERLLDAFHLLRKTSGLEDVKLVIIGDAISKYAALRRATHRYNLHKFVRFLGFLPDETLAIVYRLAGVFVFPSLYEGFGLPPLEAMASGTPVVTSNVSSLPEVVGDAALLVDPTDPVAIADAMRRVLTDPIAGGRAVGQGPRPRPHLFLGTGRHADPGHLSGRRPIVKAALVHDWLTGMRGGEKALEVLCELLPDADLLTLVHVPGRVSPTIASHRIRTVAGPAPAAGRLGSIATTCRCFRLPSSSSTSTTWIWSSARATAPPRRWCRGRALATSAIASRRCGTPGTSSTTTSVRTGWGPPPAAWPVRYWPGWRAGTAEPQGA